MAEVSMAELLQLQQGMSEQQKLMFMSQYNSDKKDRSTTLVLSVVLGYLGVDRFYLGDTGLGALKLLTLGGCGIWWLIDLFNITGKADEYNRQKAREIAMAIKAAS